MMLMILRIKKNNNNKWFNILMLIALVDIGEEFKFIFISHNFYHL